MLENNSCTTSTMVSVSSPGLVALWAEGPKRSLPTRVHRTITPSCKPYRELWLRREHPLAFMHRKPRVRLFCPTAFHEYLPSPYRRLGSDILSVRTSKNQCFMDFDGGGAGSLENSGATRWLGWDNHSATRTTPTSSCQLGGASVTIVFIPSSRWCGRHRSAHFAESHLRVFEEVFLHSLDQHT